MAKKRVGVGNPNPLRTLRQRAGLTQTELGRLLDPPRTHAAVSELERGEVRITLDLLAQLAPLYGVTPLELAAEVLRPLGEWVAYGPGFSGDYGTREEAEAVVAENGCGAVYRRVPAKGPPRGPSNLVVRSSNPLPTPKDVTKQ